MSQHPLLRRLAAPALVAGLALGTATTGPATAAPAGTPVTAATAAAAASPYQHGPDPTLAALRATRGPYATSSYSVSDLASRGFGSGTVTYPTTTSEGRFGVVAISPGYTASESTIAWLGPRLASFGFVVVTFNTNSRYDQPDARGDQLLAALDHVIADSRTASRVDATRQAVVGHSMGGGGTLEAAVTRPSLEAAVGLTPWNIDKTWSEVDAASLMIGAEDDTVAPVSSHAIPFYGSLTGAERRGYLELAGASHFAPNTANTTIATYTIAWLKRYVDDDTRYEQFLTPGTSVSPFGDVSDYRIS
ncbi:alpha/beta hydrolase [Nocardioides sp. ChNu-153]|uniref:alpha/beta hydrolase family protein n=1 Tax=Nocardioides sp. ChNu-153 TaxID=2779364 RepID=UPI0026570300|nr:alpha/beta hydrolase [Nocardioides sp. ChNu-153]MDN7122044.1 alpha/beta hydrolase [Nocardioides sp. ChNu-153]